MVLGEKRYLAFCGCSAEGGSGAFLWEDVSYPEHIGHCEQYGGLGFLEISYSCLMKNRLGSSIGVAGS